MPTPPSDYEFTVTSFKAADGECLFVRCLADGESFNLLVDGGRGGLTNTILEFLTTLPEDQRHVDVFLVTHIDDDHIVGAIEIIEDEHLNAAIRDVWFNSPDLELQKPVTDLTVENGNKLLKMLKAMKDRWNRAFAGGAVVWPEHGPLRVPVTKDAVITILAPSEADFDGLRKKWPLPGEEKVGESEEEVKLPSFITAMGDDDIDIRGLGSKDSTTDTSKFNRSSIAIHLQHRDHSVLLSSDSYAAQLIEAMKRDLCWPIEVALTTVPHHGSRRNTNRAMADGVTANFWLVSTDGTGHKHPHADSLARIVVSAKARGQTPTLVFNHRHKEACIWDNSKYKAVFSYDTCYADNNKAWVTVDLASV